MRCRCQGAGEARGGTRARIRARAGGMSGWLERMSVLKSMHHACSMSDGEGMNGGEREAVWKQKRQKQRIFFFIFLSSVAES